MSDETKPQDAPPAAADAGPLGILGGTQPQVVDEPATDPRVQAYLRSLPDPKDLPEPYYHPRIEDFTPSPPKPKPPLMRVPGMRWARLPLFFFSLFFVASVREWFWPASDGLTASGHAVFEKHEYWRLFTALFAHSDLGHLISNAPLFLIFAWFLRAFFGRLAFPFAAFAVGILSNLATIATYPPNTHLLGASGMLYGMVALWLMFYMRYATEYPIPIRLLRAVGVSVLLLFPTTFEQRVSYMAHATGFIFGILVGTLLLPFVKVSKDVEDLPPTEPDPEGGGRLDSNQPGPQTIDLHPPSRLRAPPGH